MEDVSNLGHGVRLQPAARGGIEGRSAGPAPCVRVRRVDVDLGELVGEHLGPTAGPRRDPRGGAHRDPEQAAEVIRNALIKALEELETVPAGQLLENRHKRLAGFGAYKEA